MIPFDPADPRPSADRLDAFIATGTALLIAGIAGAAASAGTSVYAAGKQTDAANHAADLQSSAADKQLAFEKDQAALDQQRWQQTQAFNLDQYNQKEARLAPFRNIGTNANSTLAKFIGGNNVVPINYVPPPAKLPTDPSATAPTSTATSGNSPVAPDSNSGDPITDALTKNYAALGVKPTGPGSGPTDLAYYAQRIQETGGLTPQNTSYWFGPTGRIASDLAKANGGAGGAPSSQTSTPSSLSTFMNAGTLPTLPKDFTAPQSSTIAPAQAPPSSFQRFVLTPSLG